MYQRYMQLNITWNMLRLQIPIAKTISPYCRVCATLEKKKKTICHWQKHLEGKTCMWLVQKSICMWFLCLYILYADHPLPLLKNLLCIFFLHPFIYIRYQHFKIRYCLKNYYFRENWYIHSYIHNPLLFSSYLSIIAFMEFNSL